MCRDCEPSKGHCGLAEAVLAGADEVLIDNFAPDLMRQLVAYRDEFAPAIKLEASGGLTLEVAKMEDGGGDRRRRDRRR
jgi:nicotinate-nucleotide pyrophosphorylase